jgi:hypothetical protein
MHLYISVSKNTTAEQAFKGFVKDAKEAKRALIRIENEVWRDIGKDHDLDLLTPPKKRLLMTNHPRQKEVRAAEEVYKHAREKAMIAARLVIPRSRYASGQSGSADYKKALNELVDARLFNLLR